MTDKITLLPDNIANQIAAGEVIQRPASAVKELLENAVDAGSTQIQLIINDAGKSLVQVVDNGSGMSETDARMCFERHATSKIKTIDDLFHIRTISVNGEDFHVCRCNQILSKQIFVLFHFLFCLRT